MFHLLQQRNFAAVWCGQLVSAIGDWLLVIALPFYIYEQTGSALATGSMFIVQTLPALLVSAFAGVFVDRWNRRQVMIACDLLRAVVVLLMLAGAMNSVWLWVIYPLAFAESALSQFFGPARSALLPMLMRREQLASANALMSLSDNITSVVGPGLGALLVQTIGLGNVVRLDALSYLVSALFLCLIRITAPSRDTSHAWNPHRGLAASAAIVGDWLAGWRLITRTRRVWGVFLLMAVAMLGQGIINVLWAIHVHDTLGGGPREYGLVQVAVAVGGVGGALAFPFVSRRLAAGRLIAVSGMIIGVMLWITFHTRSLPVILGTQVFGGLVSVGFFVTAQTHVQIATQDHFLGRVLSAYQAANALLSLCGQGLASLFGGTVGLTTLLSASAVLYFASGVVASIFVPLNE